MLQHSTYLNAGGIGPNPLPVTNALVELAQEVSEQGPDGMAFSREAFTGAASTRRKLAAFVHGDASEISLLRSTAEGFDIVGHGLRWQEGDEVLFGGGDHPAARAIWTILARRHGIKPVRLDIPNASAEEIVAYVGQHVTPRTKFVSLSHVNSENGLLLPARQIADLAHRNGALFMLDGCQAVGNTPVDVQALDCDFYAAGTYKWLLAPFGSAFLWTRRSLLERVEPSWVGAGGTIKFDPETGLWEPIATGEKFEFGARYWPVVRAQAAAVDFVSGIGMTHIAERERLLVNRMRARLADKPGVIDFSPVCAELQTGMAGAAVQGMEGKALAARLNAQGVELRANRGPDGVTGVRLCLAFFVTEEEVDATADRIASIAAEARSA
jgi:selenocysteine lyase/cysteine desulfurase